MREPQGTLVRLSSAVVAMYVAASAGQGQTIRYVDDNAALGGNGTSWNTAYKYLQDALLAPGSYDEIRVAQGTYKPNQCENGSCTQPFTLINDVAIEGGYAGQGATDPDARNISAHNTILSGDLGGGQHAGPVVNTSNTNSNTILDGFTITEGQGGYCGGLLNEYGTPKVANCIFTLNTGSNGGAVRNLFGSLTLVDCIFVSNTASHYGGAIRSMGDDLTLVNCRFQDNTALLYGAGAVEAGDSFTTMINCTFDGNSSVEAGALFLSSTETTMINCIFEGNTADTNAGGIAYYSFGGTFTLVNCTFRDNHADSSGGGMWVSSGSQPNVKLDNCIFWENSDSGGSDESAQLHFYAGTTVSVNHCCFQGWTGGYGGTGNIGSNPLFAAADDSHLQSGSPCIDAGNNSAVPPDMTDLDGDGNTTELVPIDLDGNARFTDGDGDSATIVDMGSYEAPPANCTTPGTPAANTPINIGPLRADFSWLPGDPQGSSTVSYYWAVGLADTVTYGSGYVDRGTTTHPITTTSTSALGASTTYYFTVKACTGCDGTCSDYHLPPIEFTTPIPGDFDGDLDVDQEDFGHLQACFTGAGEPQNDPACADAKLDGDADVDGTDIGIFLNCMTGPGIIGDQRCAD